MSCTLFLFLPSMADMVVHLVVQASALVDLRLVIVHALLWQQVRRTLAGGFLFGVEFEAHGHGAGGSRGGAAQKRKRPAEGMDTDAVQTTLEAMRIQVGMSPTRGVWLCYISCQSSISIPLRVSHDFHVVTRRKGSSLAFNCVAISVTKISESQVGGGRMKVLRTSAKSVISLCQPAVIWVLLPHTSAWFTIILPLPYVGRQQKSFLVLQLQG